MNITVLGCGRWGSFHAWYAHSLGHHVTLWGRCGSARLQELIATRKNDYLQLPPDIRLTSDLAAALQGADICIISISAQQLRAFTSQLKGSGNALRMPFILAMKGLETGSGKRLSTVFEEELGPQVPCSVWVGPGHVEDFINGMPNCMLMASKNKELTKMLVNIFSGSLIRFYYGSDLLGVEIGAAAKNVMGIAAGMLDGVGYSSLKGALMARGTHELACLIKAMGGNAMSVYGLSHLGDYEATLFSRHSNNRRFGEDFINGKPFGKLAEGVYTAEALMDLSRQYDIELPISRTVYEIVHDKKNPFDELNQLFLRSIKKE